jgi:hypothetical protein
MPAEPKFRPRADPKLALVRAQTSHCAITSTCNLPTSPAEDVEGARLEPVIAPLGAADHNDLNKPEIPSPVLTRPEVPLPATRNPELMTPTTKMPVSLVDALL